MSTQGEFWSTREFSVKIKVLYVGNNPMSRSMFRQLPYGKILRMATPELIEKPSGWVNVAINAKDDRGRKKTDVRQFVFLRDSAFHRCAVPHWSGERYYQHLATRAFEFRVEPAKWIKKWDVILEELWSIPQLFIGG